jgi:hypothetical protein
LVLLYRSKEDTDMSRNKKLAYRWDRPFKIDSINPKHTSYYLVTVDKTLVNGIFAGDRLKKFVKTPEGFWEPEDEEWLLKDVE